MKNAPIDPGVRIGHVHLKVADLDRALDFYCGVLGFELMQRIGAAGGIHFRRRLSSSHRAQYLGEPRRFAAAAGHDRPLPSRHSLSDAGGTRRRAAPADRSEYSARRRLRPRRQRGALSARSRRQRRRALLGPAEGTLAAHRRRQARDVHPPARSDGAVARGRDYAAAANGRRGVGSRFVVSCFRPAPGRGWRARGRGP